MINTLSYDTSKIDVLICPTYLHLSMANAMIDESKALVCAQNISQYGIGAFTGELAAEHFSEFNIKWTLVGHSERRKNFGETNEVVALKVD